jgi:hypothetical protein
MNGTATSCQLGIDTVHGCASFIRGSSELTHARGPTAQLISILVAGLDEAGATAS